MSTKNATATKQVFHSFQEMGEALGRTRRKPQKAWLEAEMKKISRCPRCGGPMNLTPGTNIMSCPAIVDGEITVEVEKLVDGQLTKVKETKPGKVDCAAVKYLTPGTSSYAQFLASSLQEAK